MAISVDYTVTPFLITIPQSDLTLVTGTEYEITVDQLWQLLRDYSDGEEGVVRPVSYSRIPATSSTPAITEINDSYYQCEFEDGLYSVEIINGNSNFRDVEVKNTVSVGTNNNTGFIDPKFLEFSTFGGAVHVDQANGTAGTDYPLGTASSPVNNITDAQTIATARGLEEIELVGTFTFLPTDTVDGFVVRGVSAARVTCVLTEAATITNCVFRELTITGWLDGGNSASFCIVAGLNYIDGSLLDCLLAAGDIVLSGAQANFLRCASAIAGGGVGQTAYIDLNGGGTNVVVRDYQGGLSFKNSGVANTADFSADISSGRFVFESTVQSGTYTVRGLGDVQDDSTGTAVVNDLTINNTLGVVPQLFLN